MNNPLPWFRVEVLQVADDLSDVSSLEGEGAYFRVLRHLWLNGPQPLDILRRKCQHKFNEIEHLLNRCSTDANTCSTPVEHLFSIPWIEAYRAKVEDKRCKKREAGVKSGLSRASKRKKRNTRSTPVQRATPDTAKGIELEWPKWAGPKCKGKWAAFIEYRKAEKGKKYKTVHTEQLALNLALKYFPHGPDFVAGLTHTMAKSWAFPVNPAEHKYPDLQNVSASVVQISHDMPQGFIGDDQ